MKYFPVYCISLASLCLGCSEIMDIMFVMDGSDSVSSVDFLHEVTFVASQPTQYTVSSSHVRFGAILYGSHVTSQINIVPNTENNLFVNKVTQLKKAGGQPLLFRALTELRKELSNSNRGGSSKQIAVVILSDKLRNRHAVLREVGYLRRAGVRVLPVGVGDGIQDSDLRDLMTFANPTYKFNSFSEIYQLSKDIYNSVCQKSQMYETTSLPQPETFTRLRDGIVTVHSYKDGKQRYLVQGDKSLLGNERGLQIEVPVLREMVEKQPSIRPFFISYSLLDTKGSKEKNNYDVSTSKPKTKKTVSGIIINNEIWLQTSTPMIKTFPKEKPWTTNTIERAVDDNTSMQWMAKGVHDFKEFLTKLGRKSPNHTSKTSKSYTKWSSSNKVTDTEVERSEKRKPANQKKEQVKPMQGYAILHTENGNDDSYRKNQTKANTINITKVEGRTEGERRRDSVNSKINRLQSKRKSSVKKDSTYYVKEENNGIYTTETPTTKDDERKSLQNENGVPVRNSLRQNALTKAMSGNSILQDSEKTVITWMKAETEQNVQKSSGDRSVLTNNMSSDRHVRPIFTLSGAIDNNVFSGGNSLQLSTNQLSQNGLSPNRIVHERPQITSNLFSPSNEFYIENGVNSISYKEHFQKLMNPGSKSSEPVKTPYSFDGSKLYSSGSLYAPHKNSFQSTMTIYPTTPVTIRSRSNNRPFYLNEDKYDQLIPSITESSTQPSMFDTEQITTRNSQTFPPNFLAMLGISLENDAAPRARNIKSSSLVQALSPANAEGYYQPETNVHFYRPAPYLPAPWDEETTGYSRNLPLRPYRQNQRQMEFNFRDLNCTKEIYPDDSKYYLENLKTRIEIRPCPPGTIFVPDTCGCTKSFPVIEQFECTPELHLSFDSDFSDRSGKSTVAVNRVWLRNNSAVFNGDGELRVWRFSGGYIGNQLMIKLRFKPTQFHNQKQLLVGNCNKNSTMSYGAVIDTKSREVVMTITTTNGTGTIKIHFKMFHWNDLVMIYDGSEFKAILNGHKEVVPLIGDVEERMSALCIGRCDQSTSGFKGLLDNMELLFCVPKVWGSL